MTTLPDWTSYAKVFADMEEQPLKAYMKFFESNQNLMSPAYMSDDAMKNSVEWFEELNGLALSQLQYCQKQIELGVNQYWGWLALWANADQFNLQVEKKARPDNMRAVPPRAPQAKTAAPAKPAAVEPEAPVKPEAPVQAKAPVEPLAKAPAAPKAEAANALKAKPAAEPATPAKAPASVKAAPAPEEAKPAGNDDLTTIKGIGPGIAKKLTARGITSFAQIAAFTEADVETLEKEVIKFSGRVTREDWVGQAKALVAGK